MIFKGKIITFTTIILNFFYLPLYYYDGPNDLILLIFTQIDLVLVIEVFILNVDFFSF